ncbi:endonuclease/exonuclease/phosphatase family protein [Thermoascus aurantiacus ATCC 26904]
MSELFAAKSKLPWNYDEPSLQPFYYFHKGIWTPAKSIAEIPHQAAATTHEKVHHPSKIRLITWNIDAMVPYEEERMAGALEYLEKLYNQSQTQPQTTATSSENNDNNNDADAGVPPLVIFLQEMLRSDLKQIKNTKWIQEHFYITDSSPEFWENGYHGTTTLVEKRLPIRRVFRGSERKILRLCNTHLESLVSHPPLRPVQMKLASTFMHGSGPPESSTSDRDVEVPAPHASILAGDLNAFAPEDLTAPVECGLQDAFLVLGGKDGTEESYTWGQQAPEELRRQFGCSRMDKILFCGGMEVKSLERIGEGLKVKVLSDDGETTPEERDEWVTDHLGLMADFVVIRRDFVG